MWREAPGVQRQRGPEGSNGGRKDKKEDDEEAATGDGGRRRRGVERRWEKWVARREREKNRG